MFEQLGNPHTLDPLSTSFDARRNGGSAPLTAVTDETRAVPRASLVWSMATDHATVARIDDVEPDTTSPADDDDEDDDGPSDEATGKDTDADPIADCDADPAEPILAPEVPRTTEG